MPIADVPTLPAHGHFGVAAMVVMVPGGEIHLYRATAHSKKRFIAFCDTHKKNKCTMQRSAEEHAKGTNSAQGRPLGFLMAWLKDGLDNDYEHHHECSRFQGYDERCEGRVVLGGTPGGAALISEERPQRDGEGVEPIECP